MKSRLVLLTIVIGAVYMSFFSFTLADSRTSEAMSTGTTALYSGTVYVAGMGGHFAKAEVIVDPGNENEPIRVTSLDRVVIGDRKTHPTHDTRIDSNDRNVMFWSTYVVDPNNKMHMGKTDLRTGSVIKDVAMSPDPRASAAKAPLYCASGQSGRYYLPVFMGMEGYVDVIDKATMALKERVWISDLGYKKGTYQYTHGTSSPDMKTFLLVINLNKKGIGSGEIDMIIVDMPSLLKGKFKQLAKNTLKGAPGKSITFREYFSNDGKFIFQSVADRLWVLDAKTLKIVDEKLMPQGLQLHDAQPTPDGKFALLAIQSVPAGFDAYGKAMEKSGKGVDMADGKLMLYDAAARKLLTKTTSVCAACHESKGLGDKNAFLCGLDTNWKK